MWHSSVSISFCHRTVSSSTDGNFLGGADTVSESVEDKFIILTTNLTQTTSVVKSILLAMALFPEVQRKAQSELDIVVGPHRLPEFSDLDSLPYIRAVVMEAWRWMPIAPLGFPRGASEEDTYKGYRIPKGTLCFAVRRALHFSSWMSADVARRTSGP